MTWNAMLENEDENGLTDRIALSNELSNLSERYAQEATQWSLPEAKDALLHAARLLADQSRAALHSARLDVLTAFAEAAVILIANVVGTRRFFHVILTPPMDVVTVVETLTIGFWLPVALILWPLAIHTLFEKKDR